MGRVPGARNEGFKPRPKMQQIRKSVDYFSLGELLTAGEKMTCETVECSSPRRFSATSQKRFARETLLYQMALRMADLGFSALI
jgi:hypothetical protein